MAFGIQAGEWAARLAKALRLSGKVSLELDRLQVATVSMGSVDIPPYRTDGVLWSYGSDIPGLAANYTIGYIVNRTTLPLLVSGIRWCDAGGAVRVANLFVFTTPVLTSAQPGALMTDGIARTGEGVTNDSLMKKVPVQFRFFNGARPAGIQTIGQSIGQSNMPLDFLPGGASDGFVIPAATSTTVGILGMYTSDVAGLATGTGGFFSACGKVWLGS